MDWPFVTTPEPTGIPNLPCAAGKELGEHVAALAEAEYAKTGRDTRCDDCAFRRGTNPNQCLGTLSDALKCVVEGLPFNCHQTDRPCGGWVASQVPTPTTEAR